ncbi:MAG: 6-bladed beta-propeller [bacterium]
MKKSGLNETKRKRSKKLLWGCGLIFLFFFLIHNLAVSTPPEDAREKDQSQSHSVPAPEKKSTPRLPSEEESTPILSPEKEPSPLPPSEEKSAPMPPQEREPAPILSPEKEPAPMLPSERKSTQRLGYHHYSYASSFGGSGLGGGFFDHPVDIGIDSQDNIYVVDQGNNLIQKFDKNGQFLCEWGKGGTDSGEFDSPSALAVDEDDNVYVADTNNNRIQKFDSGDERNVLVIGSLGSGAGKFQTPLDIALDNDNNVYVLDSGNHRVQKFNQQGEFQNEWGCYGSARGCFLAPTNIAYDATGFGYLYVLDQQRNGFVLHKFDTRGNFLQTLPLFQKAEYPLAKPADIYLDESGFLYIVDREAPDGRSIYKLNTDGEIIQKIGGSLPGEKKVTLKNPQAIVRDTENRLLVVDSGDNFIKIFDQN